MDLVPVSPTQNSLKHLREDGYEAQVVEKWIPRANVRKDLFDCIDIVGMKRGEFGLVGIQCTTAPHLAERVTKMIESDKMMTWLMTGNHLYAHGWKKVKNRWAVNIRKIILVLEDDGHKLRVDDGRQEPSGAIQRGKAGAAETSG